MTTAAATSVSRIAPEKQSLPATSRQRFALWRATKQDYRNDTTITMQQASDLLNELNAKSGYVYTPKVKKARKIDAVIEPAQA
jgi:hypothetical protein